MMPHPTWSVALESLRDLIIAMIDRDDFVAGGLERQAAGCPIPRVQTSVLTSGEHCTRRFEADRFVGGVGVLSSELRVPASRGHPREAGISIGLDRSRTPENDFGIESKPPPTMRRTRVLILARQVGSGTPLRGLIWIFECSCRAYPILIECTFGDRHVDTHSNQLRGR